MKPLPAALAVLLVLSSVGAVALPGPLAGASTPPAAATVPDTPDESTVGRQAGGLAANDSTTNHSTKLRVLDIPPNQVTRSQIDTVSIDVGPSVAFATQTANTRVDTLAMVERVERSENTDIRKQNLLGELNRIEQQVITLQSEQSETFRRFGADEITARELLIRLAAIDAEAQELERRRERLAALAEETPDFSLDQGRLASVGRELATFTGPVRDYSVEVLRGEASRSRFYVTTSDTGVVLTTFRNDRWVREVYRGDLRNRGGGSIDPSTALNVTQSSYPLIWASKRNSTEVVGSGESFVVRITHNRGTLSAYVDSGSRQVFKEFQTRPLSSITDGEVVDDRKDGLHLAVNRSYPGAPLHVRLTSAATGEPLDANITVGREGEDSIFVGRTGDDGELWTLTPNGRVTVTAIRGNAAIIVRFDPAPVPAIETNGNTTADVAVDTSA